MQYQFVRIKQTVDPTVPKSDTIDASVTVYQIHIDQGSPNFLGEDHISYCTTVRGPNTLRNVIFSGYVTFYQINALFVNRLHYSFIIGKMCFAAG